MLEAARRGVTLEEFKVVALKEDIDVSFIIKGVANGRIVIPKNVMRKNVDPIGIGEGLKAKVNANVGSSMDLSDVNMEIEKARLAVKYGADTVMDLSTSDQMDEIRRAILSNVVVPVGTVPIYEASHMAIKKYGSIVHMTIDDILNAIELHAKDGVDFMTIHAGVTKEAVELLKDSPRIAGIVSRGGAIIAAWILHNNSENPLLKNYDSILDLAREYDFAISLGDGLRPGSQADANDIVQMMELITISKLVKITRKRGVQVIVEGPGHMPLNQIEPHIKLAKKVTNHAPLYTLGPIVTDVAPGYDHITLAIGGAVAVAAGVDYLCAVYPSEHLGIPLPEDIKHGVIASKIAAHAGDIVRLGEKALKWDLELSKARAMLDWETQFKLAMDPETARRIHERVPSRSAACSVCGEYCVYLILSRFLHRTTRMLSTRSTTMSCYWST
ncbi:MAG: phosphomethylpyrimidine synthase [Candidatus Nezhaarchaeota archaeon]|nr:phosphomethylpyrimidine synthase [Candidatus Nezhaarchaeota archaeon]MCX8141990.1 phosphomethylpyrimidine synthase [Candidatus Nezhaarchaeota archaeon]MDW8050229.1 phosphomethylpyrimidine synthase [Nitrososphaerota archaeon]